MRRSHLVLLFVAGLIVSLVVSFFQSEPGYMDADYYFVGGLRLTQGHGFSEMILWNYLDDPSALPHPSHGYWMPLASILAALSMTLSGRVDFLGARIVFILISACVPVVTALLSYRISENRALALASGGLAVFAGYYSAFSATIDNFGVYMILGGIFFLILIKPNRSAALMLGLAAGLMHLSRSDGMLWLALALGALIIQRRGKNIFLALLGYLLIMTPWMIRNWLAFGSISAPGTQHTLFLTNYDDTFAYPPDILNLDYLLRSGWQAIIAARLWSLQQNLLNAFGSQGAIILTPFILIGIWQKRSDVRIRLGVIAWALLFVVMSFVFPFAGARGGFFHSGAALQPLWWALAPLGLDRVIDAIRSRGWFDRHAYKIFRIGLIGICAMLTFAMIYIRVIAPGWGGEVERYSQVEQVLISNGAAADDTVIAANPPGYFAATQRSAIALPTSGEDSIWLVSEKFNARYLVLEETSVPQNAKAIYDNPRDQPRWQLIADLGGTLVFIVQP
jgi:hypothetical protein